MIQCQHTGDRRILLRGDALWQLVPERKVRVMCLGVGLMMSGKPCHRGSGVDTEFKGSVVWKVLNENKQFSTC